MKIYREEIESVMLNTGETCYFHEKCKVYCFCLVNSSLYFEILYGPIIIT